MRIIKASYEILSPIDGAAILKHIERCGRVCYKSEDKITDDSAEKFVGMIANNNHASVLEHHSISVLFTTDRGVTHEAVRHRIASFSQESTRYCNYAKDKFGNEITVIDIEKALYLDPVTKNLTGQEKLAILVAWGEAMTDAERHYFKLLELGASPQIARGVLPNSLKTELVITANLREWLHIFSLRTAIAAHPQIREIMIPLLEDFQALIPVVFDSVKL